MTTATVGFIGLGLMGKPMAKTLLAKGFPLVVHSRSRARRRDYKPGFRAELYAKEYRISRHTLSETATPAPVTAAVDQRLTALVAEGRGADDYSALATVVFRVAGPDSGQD